jgi:hypothetical protein
MRDWTYAVSVPAGNTANRSTRVEGVEIRPLTVQRLESIGLFVAGAWLETDKP